IMVDYEVDTNTTECMCSDLQTEDYSPLYANSCASPAFVIVTNVVKSQSSFRMTDYAQLHKKR
ncbi:hypothetical protein NECAME_18586, partial [Necator americanus]